MITIETQIPRAARSAVRIFIRSQAGFPAWAEARNIPSHNVKNGDLLAYAIEHGLESNVRAILDAGTFAGAHSAVQDFVDNDDSDESDAANMPATPATQAAFDLDGLLAPVDAFLSPMVKGEIAKALAPMINAANAPPKEKIVTVERVISRDMSAAANGAIPHASPLPNKQTVGQLFGFKGKHSQNLITCWESHGAAPAKDLYYVPDPQTVQDFATCIEGGGNVWLTGPSGAGKTTLPIQFAARTGRPCKVLSFTRQTEVADMLGGPGVMADGSTQWQDGNLIQAVKRPGTVIVLDELTAAPAGVQFIFHSLAQANGSYELPTGERVLCAPGVVFVVADNTRGYGDETGSYHGTNASNVALINRFEQMLEIEYLTKGEEAKALVNHTGCPLPVATCLAEFVARARKLPEMDGVVLSLRQMIAFIKATVNNGIATKRAIRNVFLNKLPGTERAALETLFTLAWASEYENLVAGKLPVEADPLAAITPAPSDSAASRAFAE